MSDTQNVPPYMEYKMYKMTIYSVMFIAFFVVELAHQAQAAPPFCPLAQVACNNPPSDNLRYLDLVAPIAVAAETQMGFVIMDAAPQPLMSILRT